jgi:hypothetical protein
MTNVFSILTHRGRFWYLKNDDPNKENHRIQEGDIIEVSWVTGNKSKHSVNIKTTYLNTLWDHNMDDGPPLSLPPVHTPYIIATYGDINLEFNVEDLSYIEIIQSNQQDLPRFDESEVPLNKRCCIYEGIKE